MLAGVDAARARLRTDVIDVVHLHSCSRDVLRAGGVTRALAECRAAGKIRVAAYSGDDAPLRYALDTGGFDGAQASVNLCDQQALPALEAAQRLRHRHDRETVAGRSPVGRRAFRGRSARRVPASIPGPARRRCPWRPGSWTSSRCVSRRSRPAWTA